MMPIRFYIPAFFALLTLSACGGETVKQSLGLDRGAPDEYRVVARPPLSVPPQFSLRPPGIGDAESPIQTRADSQARSLLTSDAQAPDAPSKPAKSTKKKSTAASAASPTAAENAFLTKAGAGGADPNVKSQMMRQQVAKESKKEDEGWFDKLTIFPDKKDPTVKPDAEAERLKKNQTEGKPVTEGDTPIDKPKDRGVLGRLLGD